MGLISGFQNGLIFASDMFFLHRGAYICAPNVGLKIDGLVKSHQRRRHSKKLQIQGARILRNEAYIEVRCNDER